MGRKLDDSQIEVVVAAKLGGTSTEDLAKQYEVSERTIWRMLKLRGIRLQRGRKKHDHFACFAKYVFAHPEVKLPRSLKGCSELSGCPVDSIKMYLYRKRRQIRQLAGQIDFCKLPIKMKDTRGRTIPCKAIASYKVRVESWTHVLRIEAHLRPVGLAIFRLTEDLVENLVERYSALTPASIQDGIGVPPVKDKNADHQLPASANLTPSEILRSSKPPGTNH